MRNTVIETDLPGTPALSFCHKLQRSLGPDTAHTIPIHTFLSLLAGGLRCTTLHADSNDHRDCGVRLLSQSRQRGQSQTVITPEAGNGDVQYYWY